jgi:hypothetical protein
MFTFTELFVIYIAQVFHGFSNLHLHTINGLVNVMTVAILIETKKNEQFKSFLSFFYRASL